MKNLFRHSLLFCIAIAGCIEPHDYAFQEKTNYLVVEAGLTTAEGPHKVTLTTTRNIRNEENAFILRVTGAEVSIGSSLGVVEKLKEDANSGIYYTTKDFRAEVGRKYQLTINLPDGRRYLSDSIEVMAMPDIDSIGLEYGSRVYRSSENSVFSETGFYVSAYLNDPASQQNGYLINWNYTYKVLSHPELANRFDAQGCGCWVPAPKDCCAVCWIEEKVPDFAVVNDRINNGSRLSQYSLFFLPVVGKMLYDKIYLAVEIQSLTPDAHLFWKSVYDSRYNQGGLFDPTPNTVPANVRNVDDEQELVLGYFYGADVKLAERYIHAANFPERIDPDTGYTDSCTLFENSTAEKPDYWNE